MAAPPRELDSKSVKKPCDQRLLKLTKGAKYLDSSARELREMIQRGELPYVLLKENGHWRVDILDLENLITRKKQMHPAA